MTTKTHHKYSLILYLLLANGITWLCWVPAMLIGAKQGYVMPNFDTYQALFAEGFINAQHIWLGIAFSLGSYGPLIGGIVAVWIDGGKEGLAGLWRRIVNWKIGSRWYLIVLLITILLPAIPVGIFALTGGLTASTFSLGYFLFVFFMQLLTSGFGEEPGWRGFLLPRLAARFSGEKLIWILGLIWAIWHYPLVIIRTLSVMQDVPLPQKVITIIVSLAGMTMSQIGMTFIYVWLYNKTESVFLAIIFHALSNTLSVWLTSYLAQPQSATLFVALMPWLLVVILGKILGKDQFPRKTHV